MMRTNMLLKAISRKVENHYPNMHLLIKEVSETEGLATRISISLPRDLHRRFKAEASLRGKNMSQVVRSYIRTYIVNTDQWE